MRKFAAWLEILTRNFARWLRGEGRRMISWRRERASPQYDDLVQQWPRAVCTTLIRNSMRIQPQFVLARTVLELPHSAYSLCIGSQEHMTPQSSILSESERWQLVMQLGNAEVTSRCRAAGEPQLDPLMARGLMTYENGLRRRTRPRILHSPRCSCSHNAPSDM